MPRVISILDQRENPLAKDLPLPEVTPNAAAAFKGFVVDRRDRPLHDLRISVTDRCNFRCGYCMPKEVFNKDYQYLPQASLLSFEEIVRIAKAFIEQGVRKIRLTGGEPLLRKNIEVLIHMLAQLRCPDGSPLDLTLTTNGALLAKKAALLKDAGLQRVTVSLDALDDRIFKQMNDVDFPVASVLEGITAAQAVGLGLSQNTPFSDRPQFGGLKVNMVVKKGLNEHEIEPMARYFRGTGITLRFIEYMDVGATNGWAMDDVVPSAQIIERLSNTFGLVSLAASSPGETAQRWGYALPDGSHDANAGEIGLISSVTRAFCGDCNRARLSTEGRLFLCLFAAQGYDLKQLVRNEDPSRDIDHELSQTIHNIWRSRHNNYSEQRANGVAIGPHERKVEMSYIGG